MTFYTHGLKERQRATFPDMDPVKEAFAEAALEIRRDVLEEAALACEDVSLASPTANACARAIRALKGKPP